MELNEFQRGLLVGVAVSLAVWYAYSQPRAGREVPLVVHGVVGGTGAVQVPIGPVPAASLERNSWEL